MHSGKTAGWSGEIDRPVDPTSPRDVAPPAGRHRRTVVAAPPRETRSVPGQDPLSDTTPAGGLHKFDLGMVPASVTPPRSSRRAAWFAIASSAAAFGGLVFAMSALVGSSPSLQGLDLPSMPRGRVYPPLVDAPPLTAHDLGRVEAFRPPAPMPSEHHQDGALAFGRPDADLPGEHEQPAPGEDTVPGVGHPGDAGSGTSSPVETAPPASPPTTEAPQLLALSSPEAVKQRSREYYAAISQGDLAAAYSMTTGSLRAEGYDSFAERYADAASIEVTRVYVAPSRTVTSLRIVRHDGEVVHQRRELRFTLGDDPRIQADDLVL
jgi:hypothetical protein